MFFFLAIKWQSAPKISSVPPKFVICFNENFDTRKPIRASLKLLKLYDHMLRNILSRGNLSETVMPL